jgi:hypothetical protein
MKSIVLERHSVRSNSMSNKRSRYLFVKIFYFFVRWPTSLNGGVFEAAIVTMTPVEDLMNDIPVERLRGPRRHESLVGKKAILAWTAAI